MLPPDFSRAWAREIARWRAHVDRTGRTLYLWERRGGKAPTLVVSERAPKTVEALVIGPRTIVGGIS